MLAFKVFLETEVQIDCYAAVFFTIVLMARYYSGCHFLWAVV